MKYVNLLHYVGVTYRRSLAIICEIFQLDIFLCNVNYTRIILYFTFSFLIRLLCMRVMTLVLKCENNLQKMN